MRNFGKMLLRWFYILLLYILFAAGIYFVMKGILENDLMSSPFGYSLNSWLGNIYAMFFNTLAISFGLVILWNLLFYRHILGKRGLAQSVNVLNVLFILLHIALAAGSLLYLLNGQYTWAFALLDGSVNCFVALLLPLLLVIPFIFATRLLAPEVISFRFSVLKKVRGKIGLLYY
jgi:hypothetical protein